MRGPADRGYAPWSHASIRDLHAAAPIVAAALIVSIAAPLVGASSSLAASARAAGRLSLNDTAHLRLTSHRSLTLNETGSATGTISGAIYIHLHVASTNRVTAEVNLYPRGGSLTGSATASYRSLGAVARFNGTMSVVRGTGRYRHARGSGLSFSGTIQRVNDAITVRVSGEMST